MYGRLFYNKGLISVVFSLFFIQSGWAQLPSDIQTQVNENFPQPVFKSPNASGIDRYGDYNVNLFTGIPDISIPLHKVESGPLSVPVTLSYHASGIRYTDQASWTGLGWSLLAGGQITRKINRHPDEDSSGFLSEPNNYDAGLDCNDWEYKMNSVAGSYDREADLFSFSFPGKSGKFYLDQNGEAPYLFPEAPLVVETFPNLTHFIITDEQGIKYRFGQDPSGKFNRESTYTQGAGGSDVTGTTVWYLNEISAPNSGDKITITYQQLGNITVSDIEHNITVIDECFSDNPTDLPCRDGIYIPQEVNTSSTTNNLGIDEIRYKTGKVKFVLSEQNRLDQTGLKALERIEIYSKIENEYLLIKTYLLSQSYFTGVSRLKLDELIELDAANTLINKHSFEYHTDYFSWDRAEGSTRRDWFGFYNGKQNNTLIPQQSVFFQPQSVAGSNITIGDADRESDTTYLKEGVIKRIVQPTKGFTEFEFEPHRYVDGGVTKYGGGLRVKRIIDDTGSKVYSKEFRYGENESGIGTKNFTQGLFYFNTESIQRANCPTIPCNRAERVRMYYSNSVIGAGYDESPVVYLKVNEYENGVDTNGWTSFEFDDNQYIEDILMTAPYSNKTHRNYRAWERGRLTRKTVFNAIGDTIAMTEFGFAKLKARNKPVSQAVVQYIHGGFQAGGSLFMTCNIYPGEPPLDGYTYQLRNLEQLTGIYLENSRTETIYNNGEKFTTTTLKTYDPDYLQLTKSEARVSSNPEVIVNNYRYPFQVISPDGGGTGYLNILKELTLRNVLNPIELYTQIQDLDGSNKYTIAGQITFFKESGTYLVPEEIRFLELESPFVDFSPIYQTGADQVTLNSNYRTRIKFLSYDTHGNPSSYKKSDSSPHSLIWAYEGAYPVAEVVGAQPDQIAYTSFETTEKGGWEYSGNETVMRREEARTGMKAYNLTNGAVTRNVAGASQSNKYKVSFWAKVPEGMRYWVFLGGWEFLTTNWQLIEREVTSPNLSISGDDVLIDELRIHPLNSEMTTYTYFPGVGKWSQLDAKSLAVTYRYDRMGRLEAIFDNDRHFLYHYEYNFKK